ncbi:hypothetical protein WJX74_010146 [Apatococcus lobatus]|uniref:TMC domain-containing protein n=1 Tax=Apatococcus lobatus TaxID=904363 RepID=A0AAW1QZ41_9CHLO
MICFGSSNTATLTMQEDPLLRLDRLQRQLAEAQAIVKALPAPAVTSNADLPRSNIIATSGTPLSTAATDNQEALRPGESMAHGSSNILPKAEETVHYPSLFQGGPKHAPAQHPPAALKTNAGNNTHSEALQEPAVSLSHMAEKRQSIPCFDQQLDIRSQHQRRRDALANAKERLAELQRLPDAEGSPVEKLPRALRLPEKRLPLISLWDTAIAAIEARHGANVSMAIMFLRSALLLTSLLFILWFCCTAIPFIIWPPAAFSWSIFRSSSASNLVQGYGLDDTFLLYGGYNYHHSVNGPPLEYRFDLVFPLLVIATYLISLLVILFAISILIQALGLCILWPAQLALTGYLVYLIIQNRDWLTRHVGTSFAPTLALSLLNVTSEALAEWGLLLEIWHPRTKFLVHALKLFSIKMINLGTLVYNLYAIHQQEVDAASMLASGGHDLKDCDLQGGQVQANANCISGLVCCDAKCAAALGISSLQGKCVPGCEENVIGMIFYRYMITTGLLLSLSDIASSAFWKYIGQPYDFDAPQTIIQVIEVQALVWLGSMFAPLLPAVGCLALLLIFQTKYFLAIFLLSPPRVRFSAQRTSTLAYFLLLGALVLCSIPLVFNMTWQRDRCGPNQGTSMRAALAAGIAASPRVVSQILRWVVDPMVLVSVAILLAFCLAVVLIQKHGKSKGLLAMRREFYRYRRDMQSKVVWMRRGGALGGIPNNMSFSTPHKSSLIPVARLDSGSQRMRHRTHSQTGQPPQNTLDRILSVQNGLIKRATVDGSISMDRATGSQWRHASRDSSTGEMSSTAADSFNHPQPLPTWNMQQIERGWAGSRSLLSSPMNDGSSAAPATSNQPQPLPSWNLQQIERGWAGSRSPLSSPRQRGQPHRLKAMSTDGGLSQLQAQPSAPQWSPDVTYQEDAEETEDGWEGPSHAHRTDMESAISVTARADSSAPLLRGSRNI